MTIGAYLRLHNLSFQSLWVDELITISQTGPGNSIQQLLNYLRIGRDPHPPLYHLLVYFWFHLVGFNEYTARLFSAIVGIFSIPAMYVLGNEIYSRRVGVFSAVFTTFNFFNIYYSQEARGYVLAFLFTCISFIFFIRALRNPSWKAGLLYGFATSLLVYTHYYGFFIVLSQIVIVLIFLTRRSLKTMLICFGTGFSLISILFLPWIGPMLDLAKMTSFWIVKPSPKSFVKYFWDYFGQDMFTVYTFAFLMLFFFAGVLLQNKEKEPENIREDRYYFSFALLLTWILVSYLVPYVKSLVSVPMLWNRYTIVTLPAILLAAAIGLDRIPHSFVKKYIVVLIACFSLIHLFAYIRYYETPKKAQWREVTGFVVKNNPRNYPFISDRQWHLSYYFKVFNARPRYVPEKEIPKLTDLWVVTGQKGKPVSDEAGSLLDRDFKLILEFKGIDTWARLYSREKLTSKIPDGHSSEFPETSSRK